MRPATEEVPHCFEHGADGNYFLLENLREDIVVSFLGGLLTQSSGGRLFMHMSPGHQVV
jgi:hypothetical protein